MIFINTGSMQGTWQSFERMVCRYLACRGFDGARVVGATGDKGADIVAHQNGKRWLFQVKHWQRKASAAEVEKTVKALSFYGADVPVVVCRGGFEQSALQARDRFTARDTPCQLWDASELLRRAERITPDSYPPRAESQHCARRYQEAAIQRLIEEFASDHNNRGMVVMATGLGKTRVMCEFFRRIAAARYPESIKALVLAHTNDLVYQLERAFWPHLQANQQTAVWNGLEKHDYESLERANIVFACLNTAAGHVKSGGHLPDFHAVIVDECHHVGDSGMYSEVLDELSAGQRGGPFLTGTTATPWRPDEYNLLEKFGEPVISMDMIAGLRQGFLANIDYRMFTTNMDWKKISGRKIRRAKISPKGINRSIFISEWDDGVVDRLEDTWSEQSTPRAIVFCGTVAHAKMMRDKINARRFCRAEAVFSGGGALERQAIHDRNRIISDFQVGKIQVMCCVDIFNEGIDVPDVNIVVFQRVTHSRRIFVQQLGRGLRLAEGKEKVIVLDFVSDVRRFAAGLELKDAIKGMPVKLNHKIDFYRHGERDSRAESFLREWLEDIASAEAMEENTAELRYPPPLE